MRKTCISILLSVLLVLLCSLSMGCATTPQIEYVTVKETETVTVTETEYVPVYMDLSETVDPVLALRPDNSTYKVIDKDNLKTSWDVMYNSWVYQNAWLDWQAYAETLEKTLTDCVKVVSGETEEETTTSPQVE